MCVTAPHLFQSEYTTFCVNLRKLRNDAKIHWSKLTIPMTIVNLVSTAEQNTCSGLLLGSTLLLKVC